MKSVVLLGSTGSIGTQTLQVIDRYSDEFYVLGIACYSSINLLNKQIEKYKPKYVCVIDKNKEKDLVKGDYKLIDTLEEMAQIDSDITLNAVVGVVGLLATLNVLKRNGTLALANKESMVTGGQLINANRDIYKGKILPVDSEHSAIFQCLHFEKPTSEVHKLILTASGGAFRNYTLDELKGAKAKDALKHPNWTMGPKITIDCATMMNKGLEVLEAMYLYGLKSDKVDIIIHKQSIIHSMVEFTDGAVLAQLGYPSMIVPIQLALTFPNRKFSGTDYLDFAKIAELNFESPDFVRFPVLKLALQAAKEEGIMPVVLNGCNEVLNKLYLEDKIGYLEIAEYLEKTLNSFTNEKIESVDQILEVDRLSRIRAKEIIMR